MSGIFQKKLKDGLELFLCEQKLDATVKKIRERMIYFTF
jgi:hypothetical protein